MVSICGLMSWVVSKGLLDGYDRENRHRIQGGMSERYVAVCSALLPGFLEMPLHHYYNYGGKS